MKTKEQVLQEVAQLLINELKVIKGYAEYRFVTKKELRKLVKVIGEYADDLKALVGVWEE